MSSTSRRESLYSGTGEHPLRTSPQRQQMHEISPRRYMNHTSTSTSRPCTNYSHRLSGSSSSAAARHNLSQSYDSFDKLPLKKPPNFSAGKVNSRLTNIRPSANSNYSRHGSPTSSQSPTWINQTVLDDAAWMSEKIYNLQKNGFFRYPAVSKSFDRDEIHHNSQPVTPQSDVYSVRTPWSSDQSSDHNYNAQEEYSEPARNDELLSAFKLSEISLTGDDDFLSDISPSAERNVSVGKKTITSSSLNMVLPSPTVIINGDGSESSRSFSSVNEQGNSLISSSAECNISRNNTNLVRGDLLSRLEALQYRAGLADQDRHESDAEHESDNHSKSSHVVEENQSSLMFPDPEKQVTHQIDRMTLSNSLDHNFKSISLQNSTECQRSLNNGGVSGNLNLYSSSKINNRAEYYLPLSSEEIEPVLNLEARSHQKVSSPNKLATKLSPRATISPLQRQPRSPMPLSEEETRSHLKPDRAIMSKDQLSPISMNRRDSIHRLNIKADSVSSIHSPHSPSAIYLRTPDYGLRTSEQHNRTRASPLSPGSTINREFVHQTIKKMSNIVQSQDITNADNNQIGGEVNISECKPEFEDENSWISEENVENFLSSRSFGATEDYPPNIFKEDSSLFSKEQSLLKTTKNQNISSSEYYNRLNNKSEELSENRPSERLTKCQPDKSEEKTLQNDDRIRYEITKPVVNSPDLVKRVIPLEVGQNPEGNYHSNSNDETDLILVGNELMQLIGTSPENAVGRSMIHSQNLLIEEESFDLKINPRIVRSLSFGEEEMKKSPKLEDENLTVSLQLDRLNDETLDNIHQGNRMLDKLKVCNSALTDVNTVDSPKMGNKECSDNRKSIENINGSKVLEDSRKLNYNTYNLTSDNSIMELADLIEQSNDFTIGEDVLVDHDSLSQTETQQNADENIFLTSSSLMDLRSNRSTNLSWNSHPEVERSFQKELLQNDEGNEQKSNTVSGWTHNKSYHSSLLNEEPINISSFENNEGMQKKTTETVLSIYKNPLWIDDTGPEFDDSIQSSESQRILNLLNINEEDFLTLDRNNISLPKKSLDNLWSTYEGVAGLSSPLIYSPIHEIDSVDKALLNPCDSYNHESSAMKKLRKIDEEIQDLSLSILRSSASKRLLQQSESNEDPEQGKKYIASEDLDNPINGIPLPPFTTIEVNVKGQIKEIAVSCVDSTVNSKNSGEKSKSNNGTFFHCNKTLDDSIASSDQATNINEMLQENHEKMTTNLDQIKSVAVMLNNRIDSRGDESVPPHSGLKPSYSFPSHQPLHSKSSDMCNHVHQVSNPGDANDIREEVKQVTFIFSESKGAKEILKNVEPSSLPEGGHAGLMSSNWVCSFFSNARKFGCSCDQKNNDTRLQEDTTKLKKIEKRVEELEAEVSKFKQENSSLQKLLKENETSAARFASEQARFQVFVMQKDEQIGDLQRVIEDLSNNMKELQVKVELNSREPYISKVEQKEDQTQGKGGRKLWQPQSPNRQAGHMDQEKLQKDCSKNKNRFTKLHGGLTGSPGHLQMKTR